MLDFIRQLQADREDEVTQTEKRPVDMLSRGANGWENHTIEAFLDAGANWAETTKFGVTQGLSGNNPWQQFAVFLYCGKIYE